MLRWLSSFLTLNLLCWHLAIQGGSSGTKKSRMEGTPKSLLETLKIAGNSTGGRCDYFKIRGHKKEYFVVTEFYFLLFLPLFRIRQCIAKKSDDRFCSRTEVGMSFLAMIANPVVQSSTREIFSQCYFVHRHLKQCIILATDSLMPCHIWP